MLHWDKAAHTMKLIKHLANLGYGSRREVSQLLRAGWFTDEHGTALDENCVQSHECIRFRGEMLDPPAPLVIMLHKPIGYTCSRDEDGDLIYDLLPPRFAKRLPTLSSVGRLDKDTSGLLLLTDDGKFLHRIIHPKSKCRKCYRVTLDRPLEGTEAEVFASGSLMLHGERGPLLPAEMRIESPQIAFIDLLEGRYHQVRRMFAAVGNHVTALERLSIGSLNLPIDLPVGEWRVLSPQEIASITS